MIALAIIGARFLGATTSPEIEKRSRVAHANDEYDIGLTFYNASDLEKAASHFRKSITADPSFGLARAALAATLSWGHFFPLRYDQYPHLDEAAEVATEALKLDNDLGLAHLTLAWYAFIREHEFAKANTGFLKAIRCNRANSEPWAWYGLFLCSVGRTNEAIKVLHQAQAARINSPDEGINDFLGQALVAARKYNDAVATFRKGLAMSGVDGEYGNRELARALWWRDRSDEAAAGWMDALYGPEKDWVRVLKDVLRDKGQAAFWIKRAEVMRDQTQDPLILAEACAMAGQTGDALNFLEKAYQAHHDFLVQRLKPDPEFDSLRTEPRFQNLLKLLRLSE